MVVVISLNCDKKIIIEKNLYFRLVGELIDEHKLEEIDLSLSRGVWRAQHWGLSPRTTATGAKVSAFFSDGK